MTKLRAAIIGLGTIAPMHIKALQEIDIPIIAVCDKRLDAGIAFSRELGCECFTDPNEMFKYGGFDVVHLCLPHYLHAPVSINALNSGYHVLTEKPMATTVDDAKAMLEAQKNSKKQLGVIWQNRYNPASILIKKEIVSGRLGRPLMGWLRVTWNRSDAYYKGSDWRGKKALEGGGALINQSIHTVDLMNYFIGTPTSVNATVANHAHPDIEVEDVAEGMIMYGDVPVNFYVTTSHPYNAPIEIEIIFQKGQVNVSGEEAIIKYEDGRQITAGPDTEAQEKYQMTSYWGVSHIKQIKAFYEELSNGKNSTVDGREGLITQKLVNGVYLSAELGKTVEL